MNIRITKYHVMKFLAGTGKLDEFVAVACSAVQTIAKLYFIWLYTMHYGKFVSIIDRFSDAKCTPSEMKKVNRVRIN